LDALLNKEKAALKQPHFNGSGRFEVQQFSTA
jgi:hypothetical protein